MPLKGDDEEGHSKGLSVVIKYEDGSNFKPGTKVLFEEYDFYAVAAYDDLSSYVRKIQHDPFDNLSPTKSLYKFMLDEVDGLPKSIEPIDYDNISDSKDGVLKTKSSNSHPNYGLRVDNNKNGYVIVPTASIDERGVLKVSNEKYAGSSSELSCNLMLSSNDAGYVVVPVASSSTLGAFKVNTQYSVSNDIQYGEHTPLSNSISAYVQVDDNGYAYVKID